MTPPPVDVTRPPAWHALEPDQVVSFLATDAERGLSSAEAVRRLSLHGPNTITAPRGWIRTKRLVSQFDDVLIWLLIVAAATSGVVLGSWLDAGAIAAIVILNAALGYAQESKADAALGRLRAMAAPTATVVRDGLSIEIDASEVVPGDIMILAAGDRIPADGRVIIATRLQVAESLLTGESLPVTKEPAPVDETAGLADRAAMVHAGTSIAAGRGRAVATATGSSTEMGRIAELIGGGEPPTPLEVELARVGTRLAVVAVVASITIFVVGVARSFPAEAMFLTAVAMAVAAIPEGLPAVVTVSLAGGVQRMAQRGAIVRRLPAVEALGAVDVICTDKTGTLTLNDLRVSTILTDGEERTVRDLTDPLGAPRQLGLVAVLCNDATATSGGYRGDPTDVALLTAASEAGLDIPAIRSAFERLDEAQFDSRRKRMSTLHLVDGRPTLLVKGAPEVVLDRSTHRRTDGIAHALGDEERQTVLEQAAQLAGRGLRTLAFASRTLDRTPDDAADEEHDLDFLGLVGFRDEVRPEIVEAVGRAANAGVRTVMVTGDHAVTAAAVATEVGIGRGRLLPGSALHDLDDDTLAARVAKVDVYARVDPVDKVKIVEAWQRSGATVAMTGDGINDAPALHTSNIGVAMGSGTDVAREASSLVLADDNYATIVAAIGEGRRIFGNLRNVVHYLLSANAAELLYVAIGFLLFGALGEPLLAVQLLWINLLSDALPAIALGMDVPGHDVMADRPGAGRNVLGARNLGLLLTQGVILAGAALATLWAGHGAMGLDYPATRTMVFSTLVAAQLLHALNVRAADHDRLTRPRLFLAASLAGSLVLQLAVVYMGFGQRVFGTVALGPQAWTWIAATSIASFMGVRALNRAVARRR